MNYITRQVASLTIRFILFFLCITIFAEGELVPTPFLNDIQRVGRDSTQKYISKKLFADIYGIAMVKPRNQKTILLIASDPLWCRLIYTSVYIYFPTPKYLRKFGGFGSGNAQFKMPKGICIDTTIYNSNTNEYFIYVADSRNNRVTSAKYIISQDKIVDGGFLISNLDNPMDVACVSDTNGGAYIVIVEKNAHRIKLYHRDSLGTISLVQDYGTRGSNYGQFFRPSGAAICPANDSVGGFLIYVTDTGNRRIACLRYEIAHAITWENYYRTFGNAHFLSVAVDQNYCVYVTDYFQNKVWVFRNQLIEFYTYGDPGFLNRPRDICINGDNFILTESWTRTTGIQYFKIVR